MTHPGHGMGLEFPSRTPEQREQVTNLINFLRNCPATMLELIISPTGPWSPTSRSFRVRREEDRGDQRRTGRSTIGASAARHVIAAGRFSFRVAASTQPGRSFGLVLPVSQFADLVQRQFVSKTSQSKTSHQRPATCAASHAFLFLFSEKSLPCDWLWVQPNSWWKITGQLRQVAVPREREASVITSETKNRKTHAPSLTRAFQFFVVCSTPVRLP